MCVIVLSLTYKMGTHNYYSDCLIDAQRRSYVRSTCKISIDSWSSLIQHGKKAPDRRGKNAYSSHALILLFPPRGYHDAGSKANPRTPAMPLTMRQNAAYVPLPAPKRNCSHKLLLLGLVVVRSRTDTNGQPSGLVRQCNQIPQQRIRVERRSIAISGCLDRRQRVVACVHATESVVQ